MQWFPNILFILNEIVSNLFEKDTLVRFNMSDDDGDFFDTPRGNDSPKKYSWSSGAPRSSSGSTHQPKVVNVNKHGVHSNSDSETAYNSTDKQIIVTNIPTGKSQNSSGSETETSEDEQNSNIKPRRSSEKDQHKSRRYSSGSSSSSTTSGSGSRSRSSSVSENERKSLNNGKQPRNSESFTKAKDYGGEVSNRPKTSVRRKVVHTNDWKTSNTKKDYSDDDSSASSSDSESDMTDVSPLTSPHQPTPKHSPKKVKILENADSISPMHKDLYSYKVRPKSAHAGGYEHLLRGDKDSVNLKVLMEAILEMERDKEQEHSESNSHKRYRASRSNRNPSSISGTVSSNVSCSSKTNLSFSNSRAREIDRENQRLMKEILKHSRTKKKASTQKKLSKPMPATNVITSATVNRIREQERIDRENKVR